MAEIIIDKKQRKILAAMPNDRAIENYLDILRLPYSVNSEGIIVIQGNIDKAKIKADLSLTEG